MLYPPLLRTEQNLVVCIDKSEVELTNKKDGARGIILLKITTNKHEASRGLSATKNFLFYAPACIQRPCQIITITLGTEKLEWRGYSTAEKFKIYIRFDKIPERDRQQDGQTDEHRATAQAALTHSIARQKFEYGLRLGEPGFCRFRARAASVGVLRVSAMLTAASHDVWQHDSR